MKYDRADPCREPFDHRDRHQADEATEPENASDELEHPAPHADDEQRRKTLFLDDGSNQDRHGRSRSAHREPGASEERTYDAADDRR